jgi:uncharacterized membrane protein
MKFMFAVLGAIMGALLGDLFGAVVGVVLGISLAVMISSKSEDKGQEKDKGKDKEMPRASDAGFINSDAPPLVAARVARLEQEVAALRAEVDRLTALSAGMVSEAGDVQQAVPPTPAAAAPVQAPLVVEETAEFDFSAALPLARQDGAERAAMEVPSFTASPVPDPATEPVAKEDAQEDFSLSLPPQPHDVQQEPMAARSDASQPSTPAFGQATPESIPAPMGRTEAPRPSAEPVSFKERMPGFLQRWIFGGNTIVKVGVLILFLGLAFLLRYAAERVTVPVELRYAGVALLGAFLLGLGWRLRERTDSAGGTGYGLILQGAGVGVFYLTTLAAMKLHDLMPVAAGFVVLALVALLGAVLAVRQNAPWLALVSVLEGFAAPVLVSTGSGNHYALFSYLTILDIGIFLMAWFKAWRPLNLIGFVGTFTLASGWADKYYTHALYPETQFFLLLFFALFTVIGVLFARRALALGQSQDEQGSSFSQRAIAALGQVGRVDSALVFGVPLAAFSLQYLLVQDTEWGPAWAAAGFALFYLLLGGALLRGGHLRYSLLGEAYVIVSAIFGTLTIPLALEGEWTGATWAIEAAGMYWLGARQHRTYARAFAFAVLAGAAVRLVTTLGLDLQPGTPLVTGSVIGMAMLGAGALAMFAVHQSARIEHEAAWEKAGALAVLCIGAATLPTMAWMLWAPLWASVATSLLALAGMALWSRLALPALQWLVAVFQFVALAGFATTLHQLDGQAMLSNGWSGLVAALVIGGSLLVTGWLAMQSQREKIAAAGPSGVPSWSQGSGVGLLSGLGVMSLSLLYVMPADQAALAWPWIGLAALWVGLRLVHPALVLGWWWLQVMAVIGFVAYGPVLWNAGRDPGLGLTLWAPLGFTVTGLIAGDWWQRATRRPELRAVAWLQTPWIQWAIVAWSLVWWSQALLPDVDRYLHRNGLDLTWYGVLSLWVLLTSVLMALLARWRSWTMLGQATGLTIPAWAVTAWAGVVIAGLPPAAELGWLAWPLALLWHAMLLRLQATWWPAQRLQMFHVAGFWLFLLLASRQMQQWASGWGEPGSAWQALGWVLVPAAALVLISRPRLQRRWPLSEFRDVYVAVACAPVALYLLAWVWVSMQGSGVAAPLPYVPLLNPLEMGQGLVLLALALWRGALPSSVRALLPRELVLGGLGATAFALYTSIVLRTCHHWAGVDWNTSALYASTLTQASLSVAWAAVGVALMLLGHRRVQRAVWVVGAALLGVVVAKLFFIELADHGGLYRIVSFIVVGLLLLLVGYFAPVPPSRDGTPAVPPAQP